MAKAVPHEASIMPAARCCSSVMMVEPMVSNSSFMMVVSSSEALKGATNVIDSHTEAAVLGITRKSLGRTPSFSSHSPVCSADTPATTETSI